MSASAPNQLRVGLALGSVSARGSLRIAQDRITRGRMAGDPPDVLLSPRLSHIGLLEYYRAEESIREGQACVQRMAAEISRVMKQL